jgi:hypothetical protein
MSPMFRRCMLPSASESKCVGLCVHVYTYSNVLKRAGEGGEIECGLVPHLGLQEEWARKIV